MKIRLDYPLFFFPYVVNKLHLYYISVILKRGFSMKREEGFEVPLSIENIFSNKEEYLMWFTEALHLIRGKSKKNNTIGGLVPEYVEIDFNGSIKAPRLHFPKNRQNTVIIQLPISKNSPRAKGSIREHKLPVYSSVKGRIEMAMADEFAIRLKLISENLGRP